ncbi:MAG TPA: hypothetical protein VHS97_17025, partial [Isosphaeraceae bacterium]|nr:hypothetical protein [Isosphaeraceae bacterium]
MSERTRAETSNPVNTRADCCIAALTALRETFFGIAATAVRLKDVTTVPATAGPNPRRTKW